MGHVLDPETDLKGFMSEIRIAGQHGKGVNKSLDVVVYFDGFGLSSYLKVSKNKECQLRTHDFSEAIKEYNVI